MGILTISNSAYREERHSTPDEWSVLKRSVLEGAGSVRMPR